MAQRGTMKNEAQMPMSSVHFNEVLGEVREWLGFGAEPQDDHQMAVFHGVRKGILAAHGQESPVDDEFWRTPGAPIGIDIYRDFEYGQSLGKLVGNVMLATTEFGVEEAHG